MFSQLCQSLQKPAVYAESPSPFWSDSVISQNLLVAHLDTSHEGASRHPSFIERSVAWICSLVTCEAPTILDLGCGPGLYCSRFAAVGWRVTGLDISSRSIDYARQQAVVEGLDISYVCADYTEFPFDNQFDVIVLVYCDFAVLPPLQRAALLQRIYAALKPGGLFILDVFTQKHAAGKEQTTQWEVVPEKGFWCNDPHVCLSAFWRYEGDVVLDQYVVMTKQNVTTYYIWNTLYTPERLVLELQQVAFSSVTLFGDITGTHLSSNSPTLCAVAKK